LDEIVLDHGDQVTAIVFWTDEADWATAPTAVFHELCVIATMIFVMCIKGHQGPAIVF
jgi:hypothetical protein